MLSGCGASSLNDFKLETANLGTDAEAKDAADDLEKQPAQEPPTKTASITTASTSVDPKTKARLKEAAEKVIATGDPKSPAYKIGPMDVLEISVFKVEELSKTLQVSSIGTINVPLIGERPAAGRTAREIEKDLTDKWGAKYLQDPQVTVFVKEYNSQRVTVEGAVEKPGGLSNSRAHDFAAGHCNGARYGRRDC